MSTPVFAVVGHPNKGKSSLVATLARDATVGIAPDPGTTTHARRFPMRVADTVLYTLVDTPGFQRARAALDWMRQHEGDAASRPAVVARFVAEHHSGERFRDECELLRPILDGAGIIYVVDGATPYGPEYDAEMEILRWTGRPSMAIINPIGQPLHVDSWTTALGQFFRVVRVLDVLQARFDQQVELLRVFGLLQEEWRPSLERAADILIDHRRHQQEDAARVMAEMISAVLHHVELRRLELGEPAQRHAAALQEQYQGRLRQLEREARNEVERIYGYDALNRNEPEFELLDLDLLAEESWLAFGLKRRDLVAAGAVSGAVTGGLVDASLLGTSFLAGSAIGGLVGGALGWFSTDKLAELKVLHQPMGGQRLRYGPAKSLQLPFVLLGRARLHHQLVAGRTHAQRGTLVVGQGTAMHALPDRVKKELAARFQRLRRTSPGSDGHETALALLTDAIADLLEPSQPN
jgi:hypothetical protein